MAEELVKLENAENAGNREGLEKPSATGEGLPEVTNQIYYRERVSYKRNSLRNRREFEGDLEGDLTISSSVYDVFGLGEFAGREEVYKAIETESRDDRTYELFIDDIVKKSGISPSVREQMLADTDLKNKFLKWVKLDKENVVDERQLEESMHAFDEALAKYTSGTASRDSVADSLAMSRKRRWFGRLNSRLLNSEAGNKFFGSQKELYFRWKNGQLSEKKYHKELTKLYSETVETSGDEELKEMWQEEQEADYGMEIYQRFIVADEAAATNGEVPVLPDDITTVNAQVSSVMGNSGFNISFNNSGVAKVDTDYCSIDVSVYKKSDTGDRVYYVEDPFLSSGKIGPLDSVQMLPELLDGRQIDAYMTRKINDPVVQKDFSDLPDENVVSLAKKIIGSGSGRRNFKLRNEDRVVLDGLVSLLANDKSRLYPTLRDKVLKLGFYTGKSENVQKLRSALLAGEKLMIDKMV